MPPPSDAPSTSGTADTEGDGQYFTADSRRLSLGEYWRLAPNPIVFGIAVVLKLLRIRLSFKYAIGAQLKPVLLDAASVPPWAEKLLAQGNAFADKGLAPRLTYTIDALGGTVTIGRAFTDDDNMIIGQVFASLVIGPPRVERAVIGCVTRINGPRWIATGNRAPELDSPPEMLGEIVNGDALAILTRHRARIRHAHIERFDDLEHEIATHNRVGAAFQMKRGAWVLATPKEIAEAREVTPKQLGA